MGFKNHEMESKLLKSLPEPVESSLVIDLEEAPQAVRREPKAGDPCPKCGRGRLDYDGLLNLSCPQCGYALGGCFT